MPLPDVALERRLGVELELVDVDVLAEILLERPDQARMAHQQAEHLVEGVRGKGGARRAGLLAPDLLAVGIEDGFALDAQQRDLLLAEAIREEDEALIVEGLELFGGRAAWPFRSGTNFSWALVYHNTGGLDHRRPFLAPRRAARPRPRPACAAQASCPAPRSRALPHRVASRRRQRDRAARSRQAASAPARTARTRRRPRRRRMPASVERRHIRQARGAARRSRPRAREARRHRSSR